MPKSAISFPLRLRRSSGIPAELPSPTGFRDHSPGGTGYTKGARQSETVPLCHVPNSASGTRRGPEPSLLKEENETVDHQTKVALKQDQFVTTTASGLEWASENRKSVVTTVLILLAAIVLLVVAGIVWAHRTQAAATAFGNAMNVYETPIATPGEPLPPGTKTFPSATERAKASNTAFLAVANQYGFTADGKNALYFAGITSIEAGQTQTAEDTLKKVANGWDSQLASLAKLALADLYRQTGRDPQAIDLYNQLTAKPTDSVPAGLAQLQLAGLYTAEGKIDQAHKVYAQLKDKDAKGAAGAIAAQKLNPAATVAPGR